MKILFINSKKFDYSQDLTYAGLAALIGKSSIRDFPRHSSYHLNIKTYPKNLGYSPDGLLDIWRSQSINPKNCNLVVVGCPKPDALKSFFQIREQIPDSIPIALVDGGDLEPIGGDATRLGHPELWQQTQKGRPFDFIFKREYIKNKKYAANVYPFPFCMNLNALSIQPDWRYDKQVTFWAVPSHPIREHAFEVLSGQFDCDQNGTARNLTFKNYKFKGRRYHKELSHSRVVISLRGGGWDTLRHWEVPALGPLMVRQKLNIVIPNDFVEGEHMASCKDDLSDLIEVCQYYLEHETERLKMARAAYEHLTKFHTHEVRAKYLLEKVSAKI